MTLLYIASENRSGSTLLDLLLGNHSQIFSVGEVNRLNTFFANGETCTCGEPVPDCTFWTQIVDDLRSQGINPSDFLTRLRNRPRRIPVVPSLTESLSVIGSTKLLRGAGWLFGGVKRNRIAAENTWHILDLVQKHTDCPVIVDSSKRADQCKLLYLTNPSKFRMIHLVRDGRGTAYSMMTRAGISFARATRAWLCNNLMLNAVQMNIPREQRLFVRYEDLCRDPEATLKSICEFAGIPYENSLTQLSPKQRHNIGGSPHRFNQQRTDITLDERWRTNLTQKQMSFFGRFAGFLNRRFGYT